MKGVDFIPAGYHQDRQRRIWFRRRYATVVLIAVTWTVGTLLTRQFISRAYGQMTALQVAYEKGLRKVEMAESLEAKRLVLMRKDQMLNRLCPRTPVSAILSELSIRAGDRVLLTGLRLVQVPLESLADKSGGGSHGVVRIGGASKEKQSALPDQMTGASLVLTGIAADAGEVAGLIARLEESDYFMRVLPGYSRNQKMGSRSVTEFEIQCMVSDFVLE
jgi:Tfp pilus assembly protein PilN